MQILSKNWKRYAISIARAFLAGAGAYLSIAIAVGEGVPVDKIAALFFGAIVAGIAGVLKVLQESAQAYLSKRKGSGKL